MGISLLILIELLMEISTTNLSDKTQTQYSRVGHLLGYEVEAKKVQSLVTLGQARGNFVYCKQLSI